MMSPKRIQRRRTKGYRIPKDAVYVGRPTVYGNPWIGPYAVAAFREWLRTGVIFQHTVAELLDNEPDTTGPCRLNDSEAMRERRQVILNGLPKLRGKDLVCWCGDNNKSCHADVLLELANQ